MTPIRLGVIFAVIAVIMLVTELVWLPIFTVQLTDSFALPLWPLAAIYSAIQFSLFNLTRKKLELSEAELKKWGKKLEEVTPKILREYENKTPVREIAEKIKQSDGIPKDVTLRYIIALGRHAASMGTPEG